MKQVFIISILTLTLLLYISPGEIAAQNNRVTRVRYEGMFVHPELNVGYGLQGNLEPHEISFAGFNTTAGYWFNQSVTGGIGVGLQAYNWSNTAPVYLQGGYYFNELGYGFFRFFLKLDAGLIIKLNGQVAPWRVFGNPSAGFIIPVARRRLVAFSLGYYTQWENAEEYDYGQNEYNSFINLKIGMPFLNPGQKQKRRY